LLVGGSGVKQINYSLNGAQSGSGVGANSVAATISAARKTTITYFATDNAGNTETPKLLNVFISGGSTAIACAAGPNTIAVPKHGTATVTGTLTVNGRAFPFSRTFSF